LRGDGENPLQRRDDEASRLARHHKHAADASDREDPLRLLGDFVPHGRLSLAAAFADKVRNCELVRPRVPME
jgi:hypothetical protein